MYSMLRENTDMGKKLSTWLVHDQHDVEWLTHESTFEDAWSSEKKILGSFVALGYGDATVDEGT